MNLRTLFSVFAGLILVGGVGALLTPGTMMGVYGVASPSIVALLLLRAVGAMGIGVGVMSWSARGAEPSTARNALVLGLSVLSGLSTVVTTLAALSGEFNAFGWVVVVLYALFTVLFVMASRVSTAPTVGA